MGLKGIPLQDSNAESLFHGSVVVFFEAPPHPNHFGRAIWMPVVESGRDSSWVVNDLVELERLRRLESSHRTEQRGLARLVLADKACEAAHLELFAVFD